MMPLESANVFLKPRVRLQYQVPVAETLHFVYQFQNSERYHQEIQQYVERMAESANRIFVRDIYELTILGAELTWGCYKITPMGKQLMDDRLQSTYHDGMGYHIHTNTLGQTSIKPIRAIKHYILQSGKLGLDAAHLSQRIGDQLDFQSHSTSSISE
jgi:hypothetical protein